jgi:hypothetical protein
VISPLAILTGEDGEDRPALEYARLTTGARPARPAGLPGTVTWLLLGAGLRRGDGHAIMSA